jgi:hypothetical protein
MSSGFAGFLVVLILLYTAFGVWLAVVGIQYLRVLTKAARRYLDLNPVSGLRPGTPPPAPGEWREPGR